MSAVIAIDMGLGHYSILAYLSMLLRSEIIFHPVQHYLHPKSSPARASFESISS
jgi:hypothetical protein